MLLMILIMMMMMMTYVPAREFVAATASQGHTYSKCLTHKVKWTIRNVRGAKLKQRTVFTDQSNLAGHRLSPYMPVTSSARLGPTLAST
jgi:hypothetical protein